MRQQGVRPLDSVDQLGAPVLFDDDAEYGEFLADMYESPGQPLAT